VHRPDPIIRGLFKDADTLAVAVGVIGIFVPLLRTVPFLLLASTCYTRSSEKFHNRLMSNRRFGKIIRDCRAGKGVPDRLKLYSVTMLWLAVGYSVLYAVQSQLMKIGLNSVLLFFSK